MNRALLLTLAAVGFVHLSAADPEPKALLTPEPKATITPEPRDATKPVSIYSFPESYKPLHHGPTPAPEPIPVLPVRKPTQVLGDLRFFVRGGPGPLAASPDGKWLACGSVRLFDAKTGREAASFHGHYRGATRMTFSPDSARLYSGEADEVPGLFGSLLVWDVAAKQHVITFPACDWSLTPDGKLLATLEMAPDRHEDERGFRAMVARFRPVVRVRDTRTWAEVAGFAVNEFRPTAIAISPDGNVLALGGYEGVVRTWDIKAGKELAKLPALPERPANEAKHFTPSVVRLAFDATGKRLVGASGGTHLVSGVRKVVVWDWPAGTVARRFDMGDRDLHELAFSPDGKHLVAADHYRAAVWNLATGEAVAALNRDKDKRTIGTFAFAPGGERLYVTDVGFRPGLVAFPSLEPRPLAEPAFENESPKVPFELVRPITEPEPTEVKLPDGGTVRQLSYFKENEAGFVQTDADGKRVRVYDAGRGGVFAVSPNGKLLLTSASDVRAGVSGYDYAKWENPIRFWDLTTGKEVGVIRVYPKVYGGLHFSPDGKRLAVLHLDGLVRVWDVETRKPLLALDPDGHWPAALAFSKDGKSLVGGDPKSPALVVWDVTDPKK